MRIGQTSAIVFVSKFIGSALGFAATIYFARELGAAVVGSFALAVALVAWLKLGGTLGISSAMVKRMSEGEEPSAYATASSLLIGVFGVVLAGLVFVLDPFVTDYVGEPVTLLVVALLLVGLFESFTRSALNGERKVHLTGLLTPVGIGVRSLIQIALIAAGFGLTGMLTGSVLGSALVGLAGVGLLSVGIARPERRHFEAIYDYAKFSWIGGLKNRSFNDVDVILLGIFVQQQVVGIYAAAWSIAKFLTLFDSAMSSTLFPELSRADAEGSSAAVRNLVEQSLSYGGLALIPGLFGGGLLAERLLRIYGPEFVDGRTLLPVLILATLLYAYQKQFLNALNGIDRPDVAFRINATFIGMNAVLNVFFIYAFGVVGAAIATALSAAISLALGFYALRSIVSFAFPTGELARQFTAASLMAAVVYGAERLIETTALNHNFATVVLLVGVGAISYFLTLFTISASFRATVLANTPVRVPFVQ